MGKNSCGPDLLKADLLRDLFHAPPDPVDLYCIVVDQNNIEMGWIYIPK